MPKILVPVLMVGVLTNSSACKSTQNGARVKDEVSSADSSSSSNQASTADITELRATKCPSQNDDNYLCHITEGEGGRTVIFNDMKLCVTKSPERQSIKVTVVIENETKSANGRRIMDRAEYQVDSPGDIGLADYDTTTNTPAPGQVTLSSKMMEARVTKGTVYVTFPEYNTKFICK